MFDPKEVFRTLYQPHCLNALRSAREPLDHDISLWHCERIELNLIDFFGFLEIKTAAEIRTDSLQTYRPWWHELKTNQICLSCLRRKPEHVFSCGHSVCETCIKIFGNEMPASEDVYRIEACNLCASGHLTARLKPTTAGVTILSIDGGGVRGVIPLEFLGLVQEQLGAGCTIHDVIDIVVGTSSG